MRAFLTESFGEDPDLPLECKKSCCESCDTNADLDYNVKDDFLLLLEVVRELKENSSETKVREKGTKFTISGMIPVWFTGFSIKKKQQQKKKTRTRVIRAQTVPQRIQRIERIEDKLRAFLSNIKKKYYSNGKQIKTKFSRGSIEIFLFMQITNFLTDLCRILAVFKYKYLKIAAT